jgi:hypothetical protein
MSSCEEAKFYIRHCPHTKMAGDGEGVPSESQWCNEFWLTEYLLFVRLYRKIRLDSHGYIGMLSLTANIRVK